MITGGIQFLVVTGVMTDITTGQTIITDGGLVFD
jgi:hypothetical protein